jgi:mono/diheme cytochrome c family protein
MSPECVIPITSNSAPNGAEYGIAEGVRMEDGMLKTLLLSGLAAAALAGTVYAQQADQKVVIPVQKTVPTDGKAMYVNYCAPCHGVDGKGNGPVAPALKQQPVDLTVLSRNNGGKFPQFHLLGVLEGGSTIPSHGTHQMPVWGPVFATMDPAGLAQEKTIRINNLTAYLRTIQAR